MAKCEFVVNKEFSDDISTGGVRVVPQLKVNRLVEVHDVSRLASMLRLN